MQINYRIATYVLSFMLMLSFGMILLLMAKNMQHPIPPGSRYSGPAFAQPAQAPASNPAAAQPQVVEKIVEKRVETTVTATVTVQPNNNNGGGAISFVDNGKPPEYATSGGDAADVKHREIWGPTATPDPAAPVHPPPTPMPNIDAGPVTYPKDSYGNCLNGDAPGSWDGGGQSWNTHGICSYRNYNQGERKVCYTKLKSKWIVFVGDSVTRGVYEFLLKEIGGGEDLGRWSKIRAKQHFDFDFHWEGVQISMRFIGMLHNHPTDVLLKKLLSDRNRQPDVILFNSGLWDLNYPISFMEYQRCLGELLKVFKNSNYQGRLIWRDTTPVVYKRLDDGRKRVMHNGLIQSYNYIARHILSHNGWETLNGYQLVENNPEWSNDGFHYTGQFPPTIINIFHNMLCNPFLPPRL